MDWNDLKFFLAVAHGRSLTAAASYLKVSASTVSRRIETLEHALQVKLFQSRRDGYELTEAGLNLLPSAERAAAQMRFFERTASESNDDLAGHVRIDAPELLGQDVLLATMAQFMEMYPGIRVELRSSVVPVQLTSEEADIIIRLVRPDHGSYRIRKVAEICFGLYASPAYVERHGAPNHPEDLHRHKIVGWPADLRYLTMASWLESVCPGVQPSLQLTSFSAQLSAARNGAGWTILPDFVAIPSGLLPAPVELPRFASDLWLLTHEHSQLLPRVKLVRDHLVQTLRKTFARGGEQPVKTLTGV
ncbi:LysR family transcriptional regulator [Brucella grignonensis]|uniref:LysR substrate binding domain protein n=1 Tax=Brucella grignonensis TaxID=94627 RepID=A0A256EZD7_9HYPH|nr:LysR family transcriptional regulator [Brucella grignonensis]OYR07840.1 lysR substrate binding domain protein [Brucella grignonensis]